jgi:hypothetical protein
VLRGRQLRSARPPPRDDPGSIRRRRQVDICCHYPENQDEMAPSETVAGMNFADHSPGAKRIKTTGSDDVSGATPKVSSAQTMELEHLYSAHNYHPLPVVFARALGAKVWDPEGKEYLDFLSACTPPGDLANQTRL